MAPTWQRDLFEHRLAAALAGHVEAMHPSPELWARVRAETVLRPRPAPVARVRQRWAVTPLLAGVALAVLTVAVAAATPLGHTVAQFLGDMRGHVVVLPTGSGSLNVGASGGQPLAYALTVAEAAERAGFRPLTPSWLPPDYRFRGAEAVGPGLPACCLPIAGAEGRRSIMQLFDGPEGMLLLIQYELDGDTLRWSAEPGTYQAIEVRGRPGWAIDGYWERNGDQLVWRTGAQGAWRQLLWSDERFGYALRAHLALATMLRLAEGLRQP